MDVFLGEVFLTSSPHAWDLYDIAILNVDVQVLAEAFTAVLVLTCLKTEELAFWILKVADFA